jgi:hypothetical protein
MSILSHFEYHGIETIAYPSDSSALFRGIRSLVQIVGSPPQCLCLFETNSTPRVAPQRLALLLVKRKAHGGVLYQLQPWKRTRTSAPNAEEGQSFTRYASRIRARATPHLAAKMKSLSMQARRHRSGRALRTPRRELFRARIVGRGATVTTMGCAHYVRFSLSSHGQEPEGGTWEQEATADQVGLDETGHGALLPRRGMRGLRGLL